MVRKILSEATKAKIRARRQTECFDICDRAVWFYELPIERRKEVEIWRAKWLDATKTGVCPKKPSWIK